MAEPVVHALDVPGARLHVEVSGSGPVLLLIAGAGTDAGVFGGIVPGLARTHTVVAYDPRGNSRSPLQGPDVDQRIEVHADDARRLLVRFADAPARVFGTSSGAQVALDLLARHPELTTGVVAHEPPAIELLPDAATYRAFFDDIHAIYLREGVGPAMREFAERAGLERPVPPPEGGHPPPIAELTARMAANSEFFLAHEMEPFARYRPDVATIASVKAQLVLAVGIDSRDRFSSMPAVALARELDTEVVEFPGGHAGYATRAAAFTAQLADVLAQSGASSSSMPMVTTSKPSRSGERSSGRNTKPARS